MTKKTIAIDVDDVLADANQEMRRFINDRFRTTHTVEDYLQNHDNYWGYWEFVWQVSDEEARKRIEEYDKSDSKHKLRIINGAIDAINILKKDFDLVVVTSREDSLIDKTHAWLENHFPGTFSGVQFVCLWQDEDSNHTKGSICKQIGAEYLIDDHADHCILALKEGIKPLLFGDYGWNRTRKIPKGIMRVKDWNKVLNYFYGKSK